MNSSDSSHERASDPGAEQAAAAQADTSTGGSGPSAATPVRIAILVSGAGRGSNLQALHDACREGEIAGRIAVVIGSRADAPACDRARSAGLPVHVVSPRRYAGNDPAYARVLLNVLERYQVDLICLAGFLRKLPEDVVRRYSGRILNIHPALLPLFGGQGMYGERVHHAVLASGMKVTGCTVHLVDEHYDTGPIVVQRALSILEDDTPETLAARLLPEEHRAYVEAVRLFAEGRLQTEAGRVHIAP